jgi:hypothetical protein
MKYMRQVRFNGADAAIGRLPADEQEKVTAEFEAIRWSPAVLDGNQLQAGGAAAATVRVSAGQTLVTEGLAVEAGTEFNGYYVYDAPDRSAAIAFAARIPSPGWAGPSRYARWSSASDGRVPGTQGGIRAHALHRHL